MKLRVQDNGDGTFTLLEALLHLDPRTGRLIVVPAGFTTDYASVPGALQSFASKIGRHNRAAVIHDYLYHTRGATHALRTDQPPLTRAECDRIFREAMAEDGVSLRTRWRMWLGVRAGGWWPWHFGDRTEMNRP